MNPELIDNAEQGTKEWLQARATVITASSMGTCLMGSNTKCRSDYMINKATEILTGKAVGGGYVSPAMRRGNELEPDARKYYTILTGNKVDKVGLIYLNKLKRIGASVDGLVGEDGLVEIKCPQLNTHVNYMFANVMPTNYISQVQGQMWVTGRKWCDFISYHPESHKMAFKIRVMRDEDYIQKLSAAVYGFIGELDVLVERMRAL
jgi:exodeoxyribonuclease (lambda-induced)